MTVLDSLPKKKLKIKFSSKKIEVEPRSEACDISQQLWMNDECGRSISLNGNKKSAMKKSHNFVRQTLDNPKVYAADNLKVRSPLQCSSKRVPTAIIDFQEQKRRKMDCSVKQQCGSILRSLINHPASVGFTKPVDPEALHIPDYFLIIGKPMDLGTVQTKLEDDMYCSVEEFIDDVRLTFSNAMKYNPPSNHFHKMAKKLDTVFNTKWKSLEAKWKRERINVEESWILSCSKRKKQETKYICPRNSPVRVSSMPETSMSTEEKKELSKELVEAMRGKMTKQLWVLLKELGLSLQKVEKSEIKIDGFDDATLRELKRVVKSSLDARAKVEPAKLMQNSRCPLGKVSHKGTVSGNRSTCGTASAIPPLSTAASKCRSCGNMRCQCSLQNDFAHASFMDSTLERSLGQDRGAFKMDHEVKSMLTSTMCKSDPESDGAGVLDEENICSSPRHSTLSTNVTSGDECTPGIDVQLSPKKALRAAMLKSRFADTILKAKQKTLLKHDHKVDPVKLQKEKERLERQQQEVKARIEAQIRAAEVASTLRAQEELRMQREREREAARIALQKMEKTVEIEDNPKILEELKMFSKCMSSDHLFDGADGYEVLLGASEGGYFRNPLERLGLFIKDDYTSDDDTEDEVILQGDKEGEIFL